MHEMFDRKKSLVSEIEPTIKTLGRCHDWSLDLLDSSLIERPRLLHSILHLSR